MKVSEKMNLRWCEKGAINEKEIAREQFINIMKSLKDGFGDNNEISKKLCKFLPEVQTIFINKDRNDELDIPTIVLYFEDNAHKIIEIRRNHKIIWGVLNEYCKL